MRKDCQKKNVSEKDYKQDDAKQSACMGLRESLRLVRKRRIFDESRETECLPRPRNLNLI